MLRFTGEQKDVDAAARAVDGMVTLMENHTPLEEQTVRYCISLAHGGEEKRLRELTDDFVAVTAKGRPIHPKTLGQKEYLAAIRKMPSRSVSDLRAPARRIWLWQWRSRRSSPRMSAASS